MWTNENIFFEGDLCDNELYEQFIEKEYQGIYSDRINHIENMITRLQAEKNKCKEKEKMSKSKNKKPRKNTLTLKKLEFLCFDKPTDDMLNVLLNGFDFQDVHKYISRWDIDDQDDYAKIEKFISGIRNCAGAFGKEIENPVASFMFQPYLYTDFPKEIKTIEELVDFYIFTGERIYEIIQNTSGVIIMEGNI